jgi:hypothetical protein
MSRLLSTSIATLCVAANVCLGQSPRPAPAMVSLTKALAGTWTTTYSTFIPDVPTADSTARAEVVWEAGPGGFTLLEKEHVSTASGEQFLLLIVWWDDSTHRLRAMRCDNSSYARILFYSRATSLERYAVSNWILRHMYVVHMI